MQPYRSGLEQSDHLPPGTAIEHVILQQGVVDQINRTRRTSVSAISFSLRTLALYLDDASPTTNVEATRSLFEFK